MGKNEERHSREHSLEHSQFSRHSERHSPGHFLGIPKKHSESTRRSTFGHSPESTPVNGPRARKSKKPSLLLSPHTALPSLPLFLLHASVGLTTTSRWLARWRTSDKGRTRGLKEEVQARGRTFVNLCLVFRVQNFAANFAPRHYQDDGNGLSLRAVAVMPESAITAKAVTVAS